MPTVKKSLRISEEEEEDSSCCSNYSNYNNYDYNNADDDDDDVDEPSLINIGLLVEEEFLRDDDAAILSASSSDNNNNNISNISSNNNNNNNNKHQTIESSLAKELNQLSLAEREKVYYDLHGVADVVEERPEFVDKCLADLEREICNSNTNTNNNNNITNNNAYEMAKKCNPDYICGQAFRLKFLRAESFVPKKAAARLVGFLEEKLKLFGPEPLARELLLSDLNQGDMALLRLGFFSMVPLRDSAGRAVTAVIPFFRGASTLEMRVSRTRTATTTTTTTRITSKQATTTNRVKRIEC
jgi:hypothetical protein